MGFENADNGDKAEKEPETPPNVDVIAGFQEAKTAAKDNYDKHQGVKADEKSVTIVDNKNGDQYDKHQGAEKSAGGGGKGGGGGGSDKDADKYDKHQGPKELPPLTAKEIADSIIKNNGFGPKGSEERNRIEDALFDAMEKPGFAAKNLAKAVNDELSLAGSKMRVTDYVRGGGGGGGGRGGIHTTHTESTGTFNVTEAGQNKDSMTLKIDNTKVFEQGKLVGERSSREGENGGGGGGWGKAPPERSKDPFELDKFKLEEEIKRGGKGGGGGGGSKGGGKGGGKTMPG